MIPISLSEKFCCQNLITSIKVINMTRNSSKSNKLRNIQVYDFLLRVKNMKCFEAISYFHLVIIYNEHRWPEHNFLTSPVHFCVSIHICIIIEISRIKFRIFWYIKLRQFFFFVFVLNILVRLEHVVFH